MIKRTGLTKFVIFLLVLSFIPMTGMAKKGKNKKKKPAYVFTIDKELPRTSVKDQGRTGTCWCFATVSFLEAEVLRKTKKEVDLSEMYVVRHTYPFKAKDYVRMHGLANFSQGGQSHDVTDQIRRFGIVPEKEFTGMRIDEKEHNHGEMVAIMSSFLDSVLKRRGRRLSPRWLEAFQAILDIYMGKTIESFEYEGKTFTPKNFVSDFLKLDMDDYIELTSYSHHDFDKTCRLEVPDNWTYNDQYYNVTIDDLEKITDHAIKAGYTVCWDADVSDKGFSPKGKEDLEIYNRAEYAIVPEKDWDDLTTVEADKKYTKPIKEKTVTQEMRQKTFDNFTTTDDHLMHIVGIAHDQTGAEFYLVKNSWGTDRRFKGYQYVSKAYFRLHTINLMVNKYSLPPALKTKLGLD